MPVGETIEDAGYTQADLDVLKATIRALRDQLEEQELSRMVLQANIT